MKPLACVSMGLVLTGSVLGQAPLKVTIADAWGSSHTNFGNTEKYAYEFRLGSDIKRVPYQVSAGPDANVIFDGVNENDVDNLIVTLAAPTIVDPVDGNISYTSVVGFNLVYTFSKDSGAVDYYTASMCVRADGGSSDCGGNTTMATKIWNQCAGSCISGHPGYDSACEAGCGIYVNGYSQTDCQNVVGNIAGPDNDAEKAAAMAGCLAAVSIPAPRPATSCLQTTALALAQSPAFDGALLNPYPQSASDWGYTAQVSCATNKTTSAIMVTKSLVCGNDGDWYVLPANSEPRCRQMCNHDIKNFASRTGLHISEFTPTDENGPDFFLLGTEFTVNCQAGYMPASKIYTCVDGDGGPEWSPTPDKDNFLPVCNTRPAPTTTTTTTPATTTSTTTTTLPNVTPCHESALSLPTENSKGTTVLRCGCQAGLKCSGSDCTTNEGRPEWKSQNCPDCVCVSSSSTGSSELGSTNIALIVIIVVAIGLLFVVYHRQVSRDAAVKAEYAAKIDRIKDQQQQLLDKEGESALPYEAGLIDISVADSKTDATVRRPGQQQANFSIVAATPSTDNAGGFTFIQGKSTRNQNDGVIAAARAATSEVVQRQATEDVYIPRSEIDLQPAEFTDGGFKSVRRNNPAFGGDDDLGVVVASSEVGVVGAAVKAVSPEGKADPEEYPSPTRHDTMW